MYGIIWDLEELDLLVAITELLKLVRSAVLVKETCAQLLQTGVSRIIVQFGSICSFYST